ncbi:hypothetical protein RJ55_05264 [Drechmeria coniospora]|nr:hypothetical protein RJ55_05264 [Drechmeria coniospora]
MASRHQQSAAATEPPVTVRGDADDPSASRLAQAARDAEFRQLYRKAPDFKELSRRDPAFAAVARGRELDFDDAESVVQLTKTLLALDFGLRIELPRDRLCPPVPNRHNYVLWLKGLLDTSSYDAPGRPLVGVDVGTGASCIYPLLACAQRPWSFIATEVDAESARWARRNVESNDLAGRIRVVERAADDALLPLDDLGLGAVDFCMTNPPFYASEAAMRASAEKKARPPHAVCTGATTEMVTDGGELGFVGRILDESLALRGRVRWYSAMLGFLSSAVDLVARLGREGVANFAVAELVQGSKTRRWVVAWSFGPMRPAQHVARGTKAGSAKGGSILPAATEFETTVPTPASVGAFARRLRDTIGALHLLSWRWDEEAMRGHGRAVDRVWARAWRRKRKRETEGVPAGGRGEAAEEDEARCNFGFMVEVRVAVDAVAVRCRWVEGFDAVTFESFQGFLKASVASALEADAPRTRRAET